MMPPVFRTEMFDFGDQATPVHIEGEPHLGDLDDSKLAVLENSSPYSEMPLKEHTVLAIDVDEVSVASYLLQSRRRKIESSGDTNIALLIHFPPGYWDSHTGDIYNT